ncbi:conserved hypothetical protein [Thermocrinis albus DSM 14484]|uniref:Nitrogen fixation protein n=1 Tax=Thermocrinis albus (strain DSM 14484 / JCM 11386 / HI 11/12) TaxID=638303 RepID=D3SPH5_THEAH|nr:NifX-associated nitrogen fixation protein [Thermocrinis albus]ADC89062.1 conserved hypothetical protein [Thermocrinis albus DSM 14484]
MVIKKEDIDLGEEVLKEIVRQVRAYDTYGTWEKRKDEDILKEFLKTSSKQIAHAGGSCSLDPRAMLKLHAYFKALGVIIERLSGYLTSAVINIDHEGNGTVILYAGRLILINKSIRDANNFGFKSTDNIKQEAEKLINKALQLIEKYEEVCKI